ncbi:MAG: thiamine pyrophosphate-dependent enzyme [Planctomycetes bacterium]|jgi:pyruvate ferredoxin oxidoreductase beta subunit|nr:thiamine pyrophosphate-dependent enzyme [Planctomycetota bacterium]
MSIVKKINKKLPLSSGHNACAGCGEFVAVMAAMRGIDPENTIIANATGCSEVTTTAYPNSAWGMPWIHSLFENSSALASGIRAALNQQNKKNKSEKKIKIIAQGGDGATFDIGIGLLSGAWERGDDFLYICYDTEAYSNTGIQASGSTPYGAATTTTPSSDQISETKSFGAEQRKKDMISFALSHGVRYVAQSTAGFPDDITAKVKKALEINGPSYIQILAPCIPGWKIKSDDAIKMGKLAVQTGLYPLLEYVDGKLSKSSINNNFTPVPVENYLSAQGRFKHLFTNPTGKKEIDHIKQLAEENIIKYKMA